MKELIEQVRSFEIDHTPDGWPAIRMREVSALADALEQQAKQIEELAAAQATIAEAADEIESWGAYASEYFQTKHDLAGTIARFRSANQDALHEALARECERLADVAGDEPEHVKAMFSEWLREEAAAHRARKGGEVMDLTNPQISLRQARIEQLEAENAALRDQLRLEIELSDSLKMASDMPGTGNYVEWIKVIRASHEQLAAAQKDADKWRWMQQHDEITKRMARYEWLLRQDFAYERLGREGVESAIDNAMKGEK